MKRVVGQHRTRGHVPIRYRLHFRIGHFRIGPNPPHHLLEARRTMGPPEAPGHRDGALRESCFQIFNCLPFFVYDNDTAGLAPQRFLP